MSFCPRYALFLTAFLVCLPWLSVSTESQVLGPEFRVNTVSPAYYPSVAVDGFGQAIIVYEAADSDGRGIYAQRYDAYVLPMGSEFLVNTTTTDQQDAPDVAANSSGQFVVAWRHELPLDAKSSSFQEYGSSGNPEGGEVVLPWGLDTKGPHAVISDLGEILIIECIPRVMLHDGLINGNAFDPAGAPCGPSDLGWITGEYPRGPAVAGNVAGDYFLVWSESRYDTGDATWGVTGQVCGSKNSPVKLLPFKNPGELGVAVYSNGQLLFVRSVYDSGPGTSDIFAQRYDSSLNPLGSELAVKKWIIGDIDEVVAAVLNNGDFLVVWVNNTTPSLRDIFAGYYALDDETFSDDVQINTVGQSSTAPAVAASPDGGFLIAWEQDSNVYARTLSFPPTAVKDHDGSAPRSSLSQNHPNPFSYSTNLEYRLENPAEVTIRIYNTLGQLVASLPQGYRSEGPHTARWNGLDSGGNRVSSGTYFYELRAGEQVFSKKMIVLR